MMENNGAVCRGECLFGKCPHPRCIKHTAVGGAPAGDGMVIMTDILSTLTGGGDGLGLAVDIGTTTVAAYLIDMARAEVLAVESKINAQVTFGLDVISRIKYCADNAKGTEAQRAAITTQLNDMIADVCESAGVDIAAVKRAVVTGNTTMLHLLCGLSPVSMGALPFEPQSRFGETRRGSALGLAVGAAEVYLPPCVSAFVGADITCGMLAADFPRGEKLLLVDLGTNGEVALKCGDAVFATSTAAGPAFEGAHISCGMAGVPGAVSRVFALDGELGCEVIGGGEARGLCGSGLLDAVAVFAGAGAMDETGRILPDSRFYIEREGQAALKITENVYLSQRDVREFQMAKAAVHAGIQTLLHHAGIAAQDLGRLYIAGGFGSYMDMDSALAVGLVPRARESVCVGNAAAAGAAQLLLDAQAIADAELLQTISKHVELGSDPYFMEQYMDSMQIEAAYSK